MKKKELEKFFHWNKRGQFFLIAAVVIIVVIVSIVTISNYTQRKEVATLYDLGQELGIEGQNVLDYGTYNSKSPEDITDLMEQFIQNYHDYQEQDKNVYFIFGNRAKINVLGYQDIGQEKVCIILNPQDDEEINLKSDECPEDYKLYVVEEGTRGFDSGLTEEGKIKNVGIIISTSQYEFKLTKGENFYFVIWQEIGGERHVVTSD
jgi:hypothetical protein